MIDEKVLSKIYLGAVLPAVEVLSKEDPAASSLAGQWTGKIRFAAGLTGPRCDLVFKDSLVKFEQGGRGPSDIYLFFPTPAMLNAIFSGKGIGLPIPLKGFTRLKGLMVFSRLAKHMEKVLDGSTAPEKLRARLTLDILARAMAIVSRDDPDMRLLGKKIHSTVEFRIKDGHAVHVDFTGGEPKSRTGSVPSPDFLLQFATDDLFLKVSEDKVDVLAQAGLMNITLQGNLHLGQIVNVFLDRIGEYLPPKEVVK
jgi:hypothetical protein